MMRTPAGHKVYAMAAEYPSAAALYEAAKHVRDAGFRRWDVYSPFPIHGMDAAMGLGKSWLSGWVLFGGVSGLLTAALIEFGPSSILYPLDVHGKPTNFFTVPAFFPIMFELTVLFGAFAAFFAVLIMNGLPRWYHPMFNWERFSRVTNDGFFLAIEARDPRFSEAGVHQLLEETGGQHITIVHEDRSEEHTSELQSQSNLVCRLLLEKKKTNLLMIALALFSLLVLAHCGLSAKASLLSPSYS